MNLVRFQHPHRSVNQDLVDELFNSFLKNDSGENYLKDCKCKPATNIFETDNEFGLELLLPGFKKEDVQINYHEHLLTVKAELPEDKENGKDKEAFKYENREFGVYNFERKFKVPKTVDAEKISAQFENGVLKLTLPKKEEALEKAPVDIKIA